MNLKISTAPHIRQGVSTRDLMFNVLIALVPCVIAGVYHFGLQAALLLLICMATCVLTELGIQKMAKREVEINDYSAIVTGLILGLNLPASAPWWVAVIGSFIAIALIKQLFGGIGDNFVNPALAARAILLASWPVHLTTFIMPVDSLALNVDTVTSATPLATGSASTWNLFFGNIPGSIGEISKMMILLGFIYLLISKTISWRIPVCMVASVAVMTLILGGDPLYAVLSGGLLFGAVFMATDYTTSPMTGKAQIVYAVGAGVIVALIRKYGAYPEGVTYGILVMNCVTPLLDKYMRPRTFGHSKVKKQEVKANA